MYKKTKDDWQKHLDFFLSDLLMLLISIWIATSLRIDPTAIYSFRVYREMCLVIVIMHILYVSAAKPYSGVVFRSASDEIRSVMANVLTIVLGILVYCFALQTSEAASRMVMLFFSAYSCIFIFAAHELLKYVIKKVNPASRTREVLLAANYGDAERFLNRLMDRAPTGFSAIGVVNLGAKAGSKEIDGIPIVADDTETAVRYLESNVVDEIIVINPNEDSYYDELMDICETMGLTIHIILKGSETLGDRTLENIAGLNAVSSCMKLVSSTDLLLKRITDIIGAILGLMVTAVLCVFVAPAIYIADPGPIFFTQTRIGKNGRQFQIYKFRSMYRDAEERKKQLMDKNEMTGQIFKMEHDPRIIGSGPDGTKKGVGWFIRTFSIDEFPQFLNVLKGDMSLVGTRPPTLDEWEKYEQHHRRRMRIKPGITGYWQINGRSDILDFEEIVALDTKYIKEWSFWLDIKIIFKTISVVLRKSGAK